MFFYVSLYLIIAFATGKTEKSKCHTLDKNYVNYLATKTPYRIVAYKNDSPINFEGCEPIKIVGVYRHGTRTPSSETIDNMNKSLLQFREYASSDDSSDESLCGKEKENFKNWISILETDMEKYLTYEGEDEMFSLAKRLKNRFPSLLSQEYSNETYYQRTKESAKSFTNGLFGDNAKDVIFPEPIYQDPILRFYKSCPKWKDYKVNNSTANKQKYTETEKLLKTYSDISRRMNLNFSLSYDEVNLLYKTCAYETAWNRDGLSPWCSLFSKKDFQRMEFAEELKFYWRDGYGYNLNYRQACVLIKNIFEKLSDKVLTNSTFYFTHSGTLLKLISHLGLYKDDFELTHDLADELKRQRKWKLSYIDTFATNVVFVLYKCGNELKLLTMHQERVVKLPGCDTSLCPLNTIKQIYHKSLTDCDFQKMCLL